MSCVKVLAISASPDLPERHLLLGLVRRGYEVTLIHSSTASLQPLFKGGPIRLIPWEVKSRFSLSTIMMLRKMFLAERFHIVHSFTARALTSALLASIGMPIKHVAYRGTAGHLSRFDPASWFSFLNPRIAAISCVSNAVRDYLQTFKIPESKLYTIYKGHDVDWYDAPSDFDTNSLGIPEGSFVVGYVANMRPVKGADILLEAAKTLINKTKQIHFVLIGEVRHERVTQLLRDLAPSGRVHHLERRSDVPRILKSFSVFVMPSRSREGLPKSVIEAMSCGLPPIVTRVGGMPELVEDGVSGLIVKPSSPQELVSAILKLFEQPEYAQQLGRAAKSRIQNNFTIDKTVEDTIRIYKDICAA